MVTLGIDLGSVHTVGDLQNGIEHAEQLMGYKVKQFGEVNDKNYGDGA
jgi:rsbT co-antagonist protein RsbR